MPTSDISKFRQEVIGFFGKLYGKVDSNSIREIVFTEPQIEIHIAKPQGPEGCLTLFTTGMSYLPMEVASDEEEFQYAELFIQLPASWPLSSDALRQPEFGWPITWLRKIANFPHQSGVSIGPVAALPEIKKSECFPVNSKFSGMLVLAEASFERKDNGSVAQLYRLLPLHSGELELERDEGIAKLLTTFDTNEVSFVVDPERKSVVK